MAGDRDLFLRTMEQLGVRSDRSESGARVDGSEAVSVDEASETRLFLEAMTRLETIPDKDGPSGEKEPRRLIRMRPPGKKQLSLEDELDLHGKRVEEALGLLAAFISRSFARNLRVVGVVTGKGLHSRNGVGVLKQAVEQWIMARGRRFIASYYEAPRANGGKGALILNLRRS